MKDCCEDKIFTSYDLLRAHFSVSNIVYYEPAKTETYIVVHSGCQNGFLSEIRATCQRLLCMKLVIYI